MLYGTIYLHTYRHYGGFFIASSCAVAQTVKAIIASVLPASTPPTHKRGGAREEHMSNRYTRCSVCLGTACSCWREAYLVDTCAWIHCTRGFPRSRTRARKLCAQRVVQDGYYFYLAFVTWPHTRDASSNVLNVFAKLHLRAYMRA